MQKEQYVEYKCHNFKRNVHMNRIFPISVQIGGDWIVTLAQKSFDAEFSRLCNSTLRNDFIPEE